MKCVCWIALIACASLVAFGADGVGTTASGNFLSSVKPLYAAGEFDGAIAFCLGVDAFEADLICYLSYQEKYGRTHRREDRDRLSMYKERVERAASLDYADTIAALASVDHHKRGSRAALYLLRDVFAMAETPNDILGMVNSLSPEMGYAVNRLALQYIYKYLKPVRHRMRRGGTMTVDEKSLFSNSTLIQSLGRLLEGSRTAFSAEKCLVQIHEPALLHLNVASSNKRVTRAIAKVDRAIQWRLASRPSSTWSSAYGEESVARSDTKQVAPKVRVAGDEIAAIAPLAAVAPVEPPVTEMVFDNTCRRILSAGVGMLSGDSMYQIGGSVQYADGSGTQLHFPISELIFPLDVVMLSFRGSLELSDPWSVELEIDKNLTTDAGSMEDSDWLTPGVLGIYSESDTELDALVLDIKLSRRLSRRDRLGIALAGGLKYESFLFECRNVVQSSIMPGYSGTSSGLGLTYDITYIIPYLEIAADYTSSDRMKISASLGYSPFVMIEDEDAHLARSPQKFSDGSYDGSAVLFSLSARYLLRDGWFVQGDIDGVTIQADGDQDARMGSNSWTIEAEIESSQIMTTVAVGRSL